MLLNSFIFIEKKNYFLLLYEKDINAGYSFKKDIAKKDKFIIVFKLLLLFDSLFVLK